MNPNNFFEFWTLTEELGDADEAMTTKTLLHRAQRQHECDELIKSEDGDGERRIENSRSRPKLLVSASRVLRL
ncbi:hypothetical protein EV2_008007 [Malus domestica]